jgi:hypothetical protein
MRKGQFTLEFGILFSAAFLIFLMLVVIMTKYSDDIRGTSERQKLDTFAEGLRRDIVLASQSGAEYSAEIDLPDTIEGVPYDIFIDASVIIVNTTVDRPLMVHKPIPNATGQFQKGMCNRILKKEGVISVSTC